MKPPRFVWADYDPKALRSLRWAFYKTKAEQRANRPDLSPVRFRIQPNIPSADRPPRGPV